jgi:NAD(P)-dependent dehydrogenase (short-subunit alcohol dehydrogenase family)
MLVLLAGHCYLTALVCAGCPNRAKGCLRYRDPESTHNPGRDQREADEEALESVAILDGLVNNAGVDLHDDFSDRTGLERHLAVNLFGTRLRTPGFLPLLVRFPEAIVNVLRPMA